MADVFLKRITYDELLKNPDTLLQCLFSIKFEQSLKKNDFIGLKIHFGEKGNKSYINPNFLLPFVKFLKKTGTKPFLFETNTLYHGQRMNAIDHINLAHNHGFAKLNIPIIIGDGIKGNDYTEVEVNQKNFKRCFMAHALKDINHLLVLSHFTCHMLTGFGAAIKNLGMGCAARRGKLAEHCEVTPQINSQKCIKCAICAKNCPAEAIEKIETNYCIIKDRCIGCAQCIAVCPQAAVNIVWSEGYDLMGEKMVEYAYAVVKKVKCFYINFCLFITKECDCMNREDKGFVKDLGILFGYDPVAIDKASIDLVLSQENHDVLKEIHPQINYLHHLQYAKSIGLGSLEYRLIEL